MHARNPRVRHRAPLLLSLLHSSLLTSYSLTKSQKSMVTEE